MSLEQLPPATTPVSGAVTANAGTNLNTSALALETTQGTTNTSLGATNETVAASDTATSGLNGLLKRIAQRTTTIITTLAGGLPAALTAGGNLKTAILEAIPAGTNNIGDVDVLTLPATPAGTNNIGDVDVLTLPADPLGANADAIVAAGAVGSISSKLRRVTQGLEDLKSLIVLGASTNNIGDVDVLTLPAIPAGTNNIGDVDVLTVPADPFGANADAVVAAGAVGSMQAKFRRMTQGLEDLKTLIVLGAGNNNIGDVDVASSALPAGASTSTIQTANGVLIGATNETAAATDTSTAGLNGFLKRVCARLTSLIALFPAALVGGRFDTNVGAWLGSTAPTVGSKTSANSVPVVVASDQASIPVAATLQASTNTQEVVGDVAHDSPVGGNPLLEGLEARTSDGTAVTSGDVVRAIATILGKQIVKLDAVPDLTWSYPAAAGGLVTTGGVTAKAAGAAGVRNYVKSADVTNSHATIGTEIVIRDGAAGTVLWRCWAAAAGGGISKVFDPPLRGTAATLIEIAEITATATTGVLVNLQGYTAAE